MNNLIPLIMNIIIFLVIIIIFAILPYITRKDLVFGITIPSKQWSNEFFKRLRKTYLIATLTAGIIAIVGNVITSVKLDELSSMYVMMALLFGLLIIYFFVFITLWKKAKAYKAKMNWEEDAKDISIAVINDDKTKKTISPYWYILYIIIIVVTLFMAYSLFEDAPNPMPTKYDMSGNVTVSVEKSMDIIYKMIGLQIFLGVLFCFINTVISRAKQTVNPEKIKKSYMQNSKMKYRWSIFLFITGILVILIFSIAIYTMLVVAPTWLILYLPLGITLIIVVYSVILAINTGQSGSNIDKDPNDKSEKINRKDDQYWKLGSFYFNKNDPAVFVEKRFGVGWTNNWAKWQSWLVILVILAFITFGMIFGL